MWTTPTYLPGCFTCGTDSRFEAMPITTKNQPESKVAVTAVDIERSIQALNKMAERLWGDGREAEAKALLDALDALNRALDRIWIGESRKTLH